jgi:hypothetical protein
MRIPQANSAVIQQEKLCNYLLNADHERGGSKARLLISMGYSADNWQRLEADLRVFRLTADIASERETEYGKPYEIVAPLSGLGGREVLFRSIWQIDIGTDCPRLITMHPEW